MKCPVCGLPLIVVERMKIELDYCVGCRGLWFDAGELEYLAEALNLTTPFENPMTLPAVDHPSENGGNFQAAVDHPCEIRVQSNEKKRPCPRCKTKMEKIVMGDAPPVLIDRCPKKHGLWFDAGELGELFNQARRDPEEGERTLIHFLGETFNPGTKTNKDGEKT